MQEPAGFADFVRSRSRSLLRTGWLLTGNWAGAEDLVQASLARVWPRWDAIAVPAREAYVRRVMVTTFLAWRRRRWSGELVIGDLSGVIDGSDPSLQSDPFAQADLRTSLLRAVNGLPPRQRAVIVLRFLDDLSEADTASALGCSLGTVKTHAARALRTLRNCAGLQGLNTEELA